MKNNKFIALSFLAVSAVCGLASCSGRDLPIGKPAVNFYATASLIRGGAKAAESANNRTLVVEPEIRKTNFTNRECADVVVTDEDKLEYGKQDVVITITPKEFFTFRKYKVDSWIPNSLPAHPYVGLGGPHSPYSYPLQEGVAWTFDDQSTAYKVEVEDEGEIVEATFYKEKYVITVKKEYFQKNIVIDYGNVESLNNPVYVYNSERYDKLFVGTDIEPAKIQGNFGSFYEVAKDKTNFAVGSKGATVTYRFTEGENTPYTFDGWDTEMIDAPSNDGKKHYKYFSIKAFKTKGDKNPDELAVYDPALGENQLFVPTVTEDSEPYLSFFINWTLLAEGADKGYAYKYEDIQVTLKEPNTICEDKDPTHSESVHVYPSGFFQYGENGEKAPYGDRNDREKFESFTTYDESSKLTKFEHVLVHDSSNISDSTNLVRYSQLFRIDPIVGREDSNKFFSITINGKKTFDIDLVYGVINWTNWRIGHYDPSGTGTTGETELPFWEFDSWRLAQLNPKDDTMGTREYMLPKDLVGKQNLYYLYTTNPDVIKETTLNIDIKVNPVPATDTFMLSDKAKNLGTFVDKSKETSSVTMPSVGKDVAELYFKPKNRNVGYTVEATGKEKYNAIYLPAVRGLAKICIYPASGEFVEDTLTIELKEETATAILSDGTDAFGDFVTKVGNKEALYSGLSLPIGKTVSSLDFRFNDGYANIAFKDDEKIGDQKGLGLTDERKITVTYTDDTGKPADQTVTCIRADESTVHIILEDAITPTSNKCSLKLKIDFVHVYVHEHYKQGGDIVEEINNHDLLNKIGQEITYDNKLQLTLNLKTSDPKDENISVSTYLGDAEIQDKKISGNQLDLVFAISKDAVTIKNGFTITVNITWAK